VHENGLRPADTSPEDVTIRETAACGKTAETVEGEAVEDVRHVHVDGVEACGAEGKGHFGVAVDTLLS